MAAEPFDVVILGGGNAGIGVTGPTRRAGLTVAMIESHDLGGTCPNRGCTPKKVMVAAGHALHEIERAAVHHISVGKPKLDWAALIDREKDLIKDIPANLARSMAHRNVEVIKGHAVFASPTTIRVGDRQLEAKHIVIATGSKPRPLPIPGAAHMITSDEMLSERKLPGSVIFVGGGVISLEFGHVYARAGADVTVLEALQQLLPAMDADAVARIQTESERIGIRVKTGVSVKRIEPANNLLRVIFTHEGAEHAAEADRVVNGAGRVANVDTLNLAAGNVDHANGRVAVDRHLRSTSNLQVYVCGDAVPISPQLSPIATYEGDIVGRNIVEGPKYSPDYGSMATSVYTVPELAAVGLTEAAAIQEGDRGSHQRHARLVLRPNLRGDRRLVEDRRRSVDRSHSRRAFRRTCRPGTRQHFRTGNEVWHHGKPDQGQHLCLSDVFLGHQAHAVTLLGLLPRHSVALSIQKPTGISWSKRFQRWWPCSQPNHPRPRHNRGDNDMFKPTANSRALWQGLAFACVIAGSAATASSAFAGECPADKMKANAREEVKFKPVGVTDVTLGSIDLEKQPAHLKDRELRFRKLTIEPGGIVPWHSHDDRPALIFVQQGEIVEYASNCAEPILHKAGDIRPEVFGTSHWWKNLGTQTVILYVGDVRKDPHDHNM